MEAFDREFAFVAVQGLGGRETIAADRARRRSRRARSGRRCSRCWTRPTAGRRRGGRTADSTVGGCECARPPTEDEIPAFVAPVTIGGSQKGRLVASAGRPTHYGKDTR